MEAIHGLQGKELDLILHTPGGSAEAAEAIVSYLRQKFDDIRIIIPQAAMSAGTMLTCAADSIVMGKHSSLGPIDPQFILQTGVGVMSVPAQAILDQFRKAQQDCSKNPGNLNSWLPILSQYGPALLVQCKNQIDFGKKLVSDWLLMYMFRNNKVKAKKVADYLSNHKNFKTHSKHINIEEAHKLFGDKIIRLENDQVFQEKVLSAFHATMHTVTNTSVVKIICNHNGNAFMKHFNLQVRPQ
jgi:hypothetical protein